MRRRDSKLAALALVLAAVLPGGISAQTAPKPAGAKPEAADPKQAKAAAIAAAQKAYESGTKAFEAGKHKEAVSLLSTSLVGGGLPGPQMAKALYYRGVAHRKLGKPAQAMSDLTTAIWVSGGLNETDRAAAIENRQAAYREAGLGDMAPADVNPNPVVTAKAEPPAAVPSPPAAAVPAPTPAPMTSAPPPPPPVTVAAEAPAAPAPAETSAPKVKVSEAESGVPNPFGDPAYSAPPPRAPSLSAAPAEAPAPAAPEGPNAMQKAGDSIAEAGSNVGKFFSNMFSSNSSSTPSPDAPAQKPAGLAQTPGGVEPQASGSAVLTAANPDGTATAAEGWGDSTQVKPGKGTKIAAAIPAPSPVSTGAIAAPRAAAPKALTGKYQLQIAAVRSRTEAEQLADKVRQQHGAALGGRDPLIDETVIGNFGNFHRVRVGPYADAKEPGKLCQTLIKTGFDCLVVTQ